MGCVWLLQVLVRGAPGGGEGAGPPTPTRQGTGHWLPGMPRAGPATGDTGVPSSLGGSPAMGDTGVPSSLGGAPAMGKAGR